MSNHLATEVALDTKTLTTKFDINEQIANRFKRTFTRGQ